MKILSSHFAAICDKYDSPAPNGSFARRCEAARSSEKNSLTAKIFKYALTAALFLLATAFLIGAAAGYWIIVSRSDVPTSGICSYDSTNLLRYYLADESSDQFGKALNGDLGSASATYDGEFHFPIVSKTPIKKFDGYDKALLPLQFADFNYGGDLTQAYFDDFGYEYVLLTGFSAGAKISPENIKTSAEILKNQSNYTWIAGVPSDAGVYAVRITSLEEVTVVGSSATRSKYGSYIVIYTIAPATATITEAAPLGGSFIVENASSAQSAATMADDSIEGGDGTFIYGVDESGKPLNQGVKVTSLTLGGSSHSVSGYSDSSVGSVKNGLNIVLSNNVKSAANHSEADNENFWYTVTASLSGAEAGNYALSNATSLRFRIAPVELNADDIKWYYDGEATNGKTVVYDGSEHGLTALIDETTVSNRYYAKYGNDESVKSAVKSLIDAINGGSAPLTLGVYARSNDNYTAAIPSTAKVAKNAGIYLFSADVYLGGKCSTDVYLATEATNTLTINAAQLMVKYDPDPVYNGKAQQPNFTLAGLIGNDGMGVTAKVTQGATEVTPINVGDYTLTLSVSGETYLNYVFGEPTLTRGTSTSHNYKITPKPVDITVTNVSDITYNGNVHAPTATYTDVNGATVNAVIEITKDGSKINDAKDVKNAGAYTLTASLKDKTNYVWSDTDTAADKTYNWTISKLKITVEVTNANQSATYSGAEPTINTDTTVTLTDNGASAPSFVSNELSFSVTKETGVNAGNYKLTPSAKAKSGYSVDNYDITFTNGTFKIDKLYLKFSGIIEIDYGGSTTLSQDLLRGKLTSTNGTIPTRAAAPSFSSAVARTYDSSNDDNKAYTETKDAQGNITSISGEHGYYKVTLNSAFTVGSTYKVTAVLNSNNYAFAVGGNTIIVKYKTAKIGNAYYTIEDALSESASGNITLVGDSSGSASYIITSFTMLSNTMLSNYNDSKSYTLSGRKLIVPYNANGDERNTFTDSGSFGNVYSALIIPNGVSLNLEKKETNNATLTVAAYVGFNQNISTTLAKEHGVLMNNGNLIVQSGCTINAHGYIKGTGLIELKNGATAVDTLSIYDWPGGTAASEFYKDAFPTNAYTIHNISCKTKIYGGAMYKAKVFVYLKKVIEIKLDEEITVIGNSDKHGMFYTNSTDEDTYVLKSVKAVNDINSNIGSRNQESGASAKNNRDLIAVFGNYFDDSVNISKTFAYVITISLQTSTSIPLPIGYMDVTVSKGTLSLSASDYMILPGATIKVEKGANLVVGNKVDITAVPYNTVSAYGGDRNYTAFSTWNKTNKINGRLIINGTLTCVSGANIGGLVECETDGATVILKNTTATYKTMYSINKPYYASGTLSAKGYVLSAADSSIERDLASGTYYSIQLSDGTFAWYSTSANIEFDSRGGSAVSSLTRTVGNGGYTISASDVASNPTKNYYDFRGWYIDSECTTEAKGQTIFCSTTLYAKWDPNTYTITFEARYEGCETSGSFNSGQGSFDTENGYYYMQLSYESENYTLRDASDGDLVFLGWYTDEAFTTAIQIISKYTVTGDMTLYARFLPAGTTVYTIKYDLRDSDNAPNGLSLPATTVLSTQTGSYTPHNYANDYNNNAEKSYYFLGWYTNADRTVPYTNWTSLTNTNENTNEFTLYAKWDKKLELQIKLTVDGTTITVPTGKYYYYGNNYTITKWSEKLTNVSTLFDTEYKHIGFSSVEDNIATVTVEKYVNANVDEFTITVNSKPANPPEAIILVADVRKVIKVTLNMSATVTCEHSHYGLNNEKFKIASITFSKEEWYRDVNNSNWSYSDKLSASEITGELVFYVLSGVELTITTSNLPCNGKNWKLQNCGKTYYPTWNYDSTINNASYAHTSKTTTFKITPNGKGNIAVNWSGSEN